MKGMRKAVYHGKDEFQRTVIKLMDSLQGRYSRWEIWQDFIIMSAISIANVLGGPYRDQREKLYLDRARKYQKPELEVFVQIFAEVFDEMERDPDQDVLGELFMMLGLGNKWKGQFFTPYTVSRAMASMNIGTDIKQRIEEKGWISVGDPACGAGALLIAYANECRKQNINYQTSVLFVAQDIDFLAGCMCYLQLSILGCPGYIVIDDTLAKPSLSCYGHGLIPVDSPNAWYTPMYFRDEWCWRRLFAQLSFREQAK